MILDLLYTVREFLNRDIRSFFPIGRIPRNSSDTLQQDIVIDTESETSGCEVATQPPQVLLQPLPLMLNFADLIRIERKRLLIDWRDESLLKIWIQVNLSLSRFTDHIDFLLDKVSIFKRISTDNASKVLAAEFYNRVYLGLISEVRVHEVKLIEQLESWAIYESSQIQIVDEFRDIQLPFLDDIGFKPSNRVKILTVLKEHLLGNGGIVAAFHGQIANTTDKLIRKVML